MENVIARLNAIAVTLNKVEVKGRENLDCLLASIAATENSASELKAISEAHAKEVAALQDRNYELEAKLKELMYPRNRPESGQDCPESDEEEVGAYTYHQQPERL